MPSRSPAQARLMAMIAHGGKANGPAPPLAVAKEFNRADAKTGILRKKKGKKQTGGNMGVSAGSDGGIGGR